MWTVAAVGGCDGVVRPLRHGGEEDNEGSGRRRKKRKMMKGREREVKERLGVVAISHLSHSLFGMVRRDGRGERGGH